MATAPGTNPWSCRAQTCDARPARQAAASQYRERVTVSAFATVHLAASWTAPQGDGERPWVQAGGNPVLEQRTNDDAASETHSLPELKAPAAPRRSRPKTRISSRRRASQTMRRILPVRCGEKLAEALMARSCAISGPACLRTISGEAKRDL
jgi:hypothetical protein